MDLPLSGLRIATERAVKDRISDRCRIAVADGSRLPFRDRSFDAVSHSDVLCCLRDKRGVLEACRRVIRDSGRMVFTVNLVQRRRLSEVEQTSRPRKLTLPLEGRLLGARQSYQRRGPDFAS